MAGGMHFLIGIATDDYVILASDKATFAYGAVLADDNNDKEYRLGKKLTMMCIGEEGDVAQFGDWTKRNIRLYAIRNDNDKEYRLGKKLTMMCIGEEGDVAQFGDWTKRNIRLYAIRNGYELCPKSAHHWIRRGIAEALRTEDYYAVDVLLGG
ncbi:hypothetical protein ANCCAN_21053 [Ancylostoma caninum]|uniref:Proteasome subunit beta n=1 Tax=Ancylostoma caninum TaxID=29170 RepID=A0A368FLM3_ANCCA|nr:hypothetical protein ANCCAN_21053 [Ancylostoma caninum]